jgi:hypothetical protein
MSELSLKEIEAGIDRLPEEEQTALLKQLMGRYLPHLAPYAALPLGVRGASKASWVASQNIPDNVDAFLASEPPQLTAAEQRAYERAKDIVQKGRRASDPRIIGAFAGLIQVSDDFDAPLPDEALFWGEETDEYGLMQPQ